MFSQQNNGWWCPKCNAYHAPSVVTCPNASNPLYPPVTQPEVQPFKPWYPQPYDPIYPDDYTGVSKSVCPKCGLTLEPVMGYVCPQPGCPTGLGGTYCMLNETSQTKS